MLSSIADIATAKQSLGHPVAERGHVYAVLVDLFEDMKAHPESVSVETGDIMLARGLDDETGRHTGPIAVFLRVRLDPEWAKGETP
jgi:hypothetical protein